MCPSKRGLVRRISRYAVADGPGIRSIIFLKGCPLRCLWCSSPQTWSLSPQVIFIERRCKDARICLAACPEGAIRIERGKPKIDRDKCTNCGKCSDACAHGAFELVGNWMTAEEVLAIAAKDRPYYAKSGGGITLSGGEPLLQTDFAIALLRGAHELGIHTAVETTGHLAREDFRRSLEHTDMLLYDLKHMDPTKHRELTGVTNERILDNLRYAAASFKQTRIVVCYPYIQGYNTSKENIERMMRFLDEIGVRELDIFPFHKLGVHEYEELGIEYPLRDQPLPSKEDLEKLEGFFSQRGFTIVEW